MEKAFRNDQFVIINSIQKEKLNTMPIASGSVQLGCIQYFPGIPK